MRILYIYRSLGAGPSIRRVFEPIEKELKNRGVDVDSVYLPYERITIKNIYLNLKCLREKLSVGHYDIVHITGDVYYLQYFLRKYKTVLTVHDLGFYTNFAKSFKMQLLKLLWIRPISKATFVTFISKKSLDEGRQFIGAYQNVKVIPNPYDSMFKFKEKKIDVQYPVILHVGTKPNKNLSRVIEALKKFRCKLHIIGPIQSENLNKLQEYGLDFFSETYVSDEGLREAYEKCDIVSFPSLYEGFGLPIIEAQAIGRPVVTSNRSPMSEIANDSAILVDPEDIDSITNGFKEALKYHDTLIKKGLENSKKYNVKEIASQYLNLYKTL